MADPEVDGGKRGFLVAATSVMGGVVAGATAIPLVASMFPSERARAAGAPVEADIAGLAPGDMKIVEWRGKPVWIVRRSKEMLEAIQKNDSLVADPKSEVPHQPNYAKNEFRSIKADIAVLVGVCTHLGCSPKLRPADDKEAMGMDWNGGFYCPCHGSKFDFAGRVFKGVPAPTNLVVPPYTFAGDTKIIIGEDSKGA